MSKNKNDNFRAGARAMFDALTARAANNYHADPALDEICNKENELIQSWAEDALEEISPEDAAAWKSISEAFSAGYASGKRAAKYSSKKSD